MKRAAILFSTLALSAFVLFGFTLNANAGTTPKTTGSVGLSGPTQYVSFNAFQTNPVKGSVSYTNFDYAVSGTGVWLPSGTFDLDLYLGGLGGSGPYKHTLTVTSFTPVSPTAVVFSGTAYYTSEPTFTETFSGTVSGSSFNLTLIPDDGGFKYGWISATFVGTIASDGTITGTWSDTLGRIDAFTSTGGLDEVFHYVAPVITTSVSNSTATFTYVIPAGIVLAGTNIEMIVTDGGSPGAGHDTFVINGTPYNIVSGNLTVFA